jgi:hypothetical protein
VRRREVRCWLQLSVASRECYHCKQQIAEGEAHDCWTTTEAALTRELSEDLQDAWQRLRETAVALGEQRIYASHHSIMFSRTSCYFFVRPRRKFLEVFVFLGRTVTAPAVRRTDRASKTKIAHVLHIRHRDEVEAPITDWLAEAYDWSAVPRAEAVRKVATMKPRRGPAAAPKRAAARKASRGGRR